MKCGTISAWEEKPTKFHQVPSQVQKEITMKMTEKNFTAVKHTIGRNVDDDTVLSYVYAASDDWPKGYGYSDWGSTEFWISHLQTEDGKKALRAWLDQKGFKAYKHSIDEAISLACSDLRNAAEAVGNDSVADAVRYALDLDNL
jgi:hypothetical protein